jgi:phosphoglycerate dehydrogenase-like enzyme
MRTDGGKVLVTVDWLHTVPQHAQRMRERIESDGFEVSVFPTRRSLTESEVTPLVGDIVGYLAGNDVLNRRVIDKANLLRVISRQGAGFDRIDLEACTERGIVVCNAFGAGAPAVAEFTLGSILAIGRHVFAAQSALRAGNWSVRTEIGGSSPVGATLGVVGLGHIGRELVRLVQGLRMRVLYFDVVRAPDEGTLGAEFVELDHLLAEADFVSVHVGLNPATHHLIAKRELALMKPTAYLVNTSRGGVIDEHALYEAIISGEIAGAALDVFEEEPLSTDSPLLRLTDTVLLTPHMAGLSDAAKEAMLELATDNLLDVLAGRTPRYVTNPGVMAKISNAAQGAPST